MDTKLSQAEIQILEAVLGTIRRLRDAGLARAFTLEVEVRGRQVEVKTRAFVTGFSIEDAPSPLSREGGGG